MTLGLAMIGVLDQVRGGWLHELSPMPMPNLDFDLAHSSVKLLRRERLFVSGQMDGLHG